MEGESQVSKPIIIITAIIMIAIVAVGLYFVIKFTSSINSESAVQTFEGDHNELIMEASSKHTNEIAMLNQISSSTSSSSDTSTSSYATLKDVHSYTKYLEDGLYKTATQSYSVNSSGDYNMISYGYNYNQYGVMFIYPSTWNTSIHSFDAISNDSPVITCSESGYMSSPSAFLTEIEINSSQNYTQEQALNLLKQEIQGYFSDLGYGSASNFNISNITLYDKTTTVLSYDASLSAYYNFEVYNTVIVDGSYIYILTVSIPTNDTNNDNIELKDLMISSFEGFNI